MSRSPGVLRYAWRVSDILAFHQVATAPFVANSVVVRAPIRVHRIDYVDFILVIGGRGRIRPDAESSEGAVEVLSRGQLRVFRPCDDHQLEGLAPAGVSLMVVSVPLARWDSFAALADVELVLDARTGPPLVTVDATDPTVRQPFERAVACFAEGATGTDLARFLAEVTPLFPFTSSSRADSPKWLTAAIDAMHHEPNLRVGLSRFVELSHVSGRHLAVITGRTYGKTPRRIVAEIRLRHGAMLLLSTDLTIGDIAVRCGYANHAHFTDAFHRFHGVSPSAYRR